MLIDRSLTAKNLGHRSGDVKFIVLHDTAGSGTPADAEYLAHDPEHRGISVDFVALKDGRIRQLNPDLHKHCTFHAGRHTQMDVDGNKYLNGAVNQHSIGIEISQKADIRGLSPLYPDEQVKAVAELCLDLCKVFGLNPSDHITTHAKIITDGSRTDPRNFPWAAFWQYIGGGTPAPINSNDYIVQAGDSLWAIATKFHTSVEALKALNGLNTASNLITPGQRLKTSN